MAPYDFLNRWFMRLSCTYGLLLMLSLFDSGSYAIPEPKPTTPTATTAEDREKQAKEAEKAKESEKKDFKAKNISEFDRKKDEQSKLEAPGMGAFERFVKRMPHYLRWWNAEYVPYEVFIIAMTGCSLSGLWLLQWMLKKFKGGRD